MVNRSNLLALTDTWKAENKEINIPKPKVREKSKKIQPHNIVFMSELYSSGNKIMKKKDEPKKQYFGFLTNNNLRDRAA
jgi:hypothetical protein